MRITGTFLDEISHDIPHQNWGEKEWRKDFAAMKAIGIDTVIQIRCGHRRFITFPSKVLMEKHDCYLPPVDLTDLFLRLADEFDMKFFFGLYDSGYYWIHNKCQQELDISRAVADEVWQKYGHYKSFGGWYLCWEISRTYAGMVNLYHDLGMHLKDISNNLPTMISPCIAGIKCDPNNVATIEEHQRTWDNIMAGISGAMDIVAFQDGHCDYDELADYLILNKELADRHGLKSWTNCESIDRDMPWRFPPIKWEKMLLKLEAARKAQLDKAITFEFSHFVSPNSMYPSAGHLYNRYKEYFGL